MSSLVRVAPALDKFKIFRTLGYKPHAGQMEVHRSTAPRRVAIWGTRTGKTTCAAHEAIAAALQPSSRPTRGWCVAPNYDLCDKVFREISFVFQGQLKRFLVKASDSDRTLLVRNMGGSTCEIKGKTADNKVSLLGEGLSWCIVDEAAQLHPQIWERYLSARLIDHQGWAMLISTPKGKGWLYDAFRRKDPRWESWRLPTSANPHVNVEELEALKRITPELIWRQEYEAEFLEGVGQVFRNVRDLATGEMREPLPDESYSGGLDLAITNDYTVLTIYDSQRRVVFWDRFTRLDWSLQLPRIKAATEKYNDAFVTVDSTSMGGEFIVEALLEAGIRAEGYTFTVSSKAALVGNLSMMLERREIELPREDLWPECVDEMESFEYSVTDHGTVRTSSPPGCHDDIVCSIMLAAWALRDVGEFEAQLL